MASIQEILADVLPATSAGGQTKTAAPAGGPGNSPESVAQMLENLGLSDDSGRVKTAAASATSTKGENMQGSLTDIYSRLVSEPVPAGEAGSTPDEGATKVASEGGGEGEPTDAVSTFGGVVGEYFGIQMGSMLEKAAGDVEAEAGKGEKPQAHAPGAPSTLGSPGDPALPVNHSASSGAALKVTTGGSTPYSLKGAALKAILKRLPGEGAVVGSIKQ